MATTDLIGAQTRTSTAPLPSAATAEKVVGFRIMRETEIAPHWWAQPVEIGETGSGTVADTFCTAQNTVTMDPNRTKRQRYFAEPILAPDVDTPTQPMSPADMAAHDLATYVRPPVTPVVVRALTRYEIATARYDELDARPASTLSAAEFDAMQDAQQTLSEAFGVLAEAERLDLIEPAETAARYRWASVHCRRLAETADFDGCLEAQDEMTMCRCQLAAAGRLDLIEAA